MWRRRAFLAQPDPSLMENSMTNRWLTGVAAVALTLAGAVAAQAADLPTKKMAPAPVFVPPPFTWTGFYIGANAGGIWETGKTNSTFYAGGFPFLTTSNSNRLGSGSSGFIGGGQAGYNWQSGALVFGVETDFDGTSLSKSGSSSGLPFSGLSPAYALYTNDYLISHESTRLSWLGTTRGRVGFVATPDNRLMIYGTGGVAYGGGKVDYSVYDAYHGLGWTGEKNSTRFGWTIGAGVEYAITDHITIKGEYLYANLGNNTLTAAPSLVASTVFPGTYASTKVNYEASIFRAGVNYKF
jgi:outer membrane immunogenic protein